MNVRDTYAQLREELLDRHSPQWAVVASGLLAGVFIPLFLGALALAVIGLVSLGRSLGGVEPSRPWSFPWIPAAGVVLSYSALAGVAGAEAWRAGDRFGQHGQGARFFAFVVCALPGSCWAWLRLSVDATFDTAGVGIAAIALFAAMTVHLVWQGQYYDILDRLSPVRWAEAAIRMLREDYYDDWLRYNEKLARFKHETKLVRTGEWELFIQVEREERRQLAEEETRREKEVRALLRPDLYPDDLPRSLVAHTATTSLGGKRRSSWGRRRPGKGLRWIM